MIILDEKGKLFGKVSIIDIAALLILLIIITCGILTYIHAAGPTSANSHETGFDDICVELNLLNIEDCTKNSIVTGNKVYLSETGIYFGEITKINSKPHQEAITGTDGTMVFSDVPGRYDLNLYIKVSGKQTDKGFYSSENLHLACGDTLSIKTETTESTTVINKVYLGEENISEKTN